MKSKMGWLLVRCVVVAFFALSEPTMFDSPQAARLDEFPFCAFVFCLIGVPVALLLSYKQAMKKPAPKQRFRDWSRPSWFSNPFAGQPHFMHMAGHAFVTMGLVGLVHSALMGTAASIGLFPLAFGWGILLGNTLFYSFPIGKV